MTTNTDQATELRRYRTVSAYMNNQTPEEWANMAHAVMADVRAGDDIPDLAESAAWDILRASYWNAVRAIVADVAAEEIPTEDARTEYVEQSVDGSQWVIYTWRAGIVLAVSDNGDAYDNEIGESGANESVRAFYAMLRDVCDLLPEWEEHEEDDSGA